MRWASGDGVSPSVAGLTPVRQGWPRCGAVWRGLATADDLSTEPYGALCWVLRNPDMVCCGLASRGAAEHGRAGLGRARQPLQTAALEPSGSSAALYGGQTGRGSLRRDSVRQHKSWRGGAWQR